MSPMYPPHLWVAARVIYGSPYCDGYRSTANAANAATAAEWMLDDSGCDWQQGSAQSAQSTLSAEWGANLRLCCHDWTGSSCLCWHRALVCGLTKEFGSYLSRSWGCRVYHSPATLNPVPRSSLTWIATISVAESLTSWIRLCFGRSPTKWETMLAYLFVPA